METSQIETIRRGVEKAYSEMTDDNAPRYCVTLETRTLEKKDVWVQVLAGTINMFYPSAREPDAVLQLAGIALPPGTELLEWQAEEFATFSMGDASADAIAAFIDALFVRILGCDPEGYEVRTSEEALEE